jgi:hypothetical protein
MVTQTALETTTPVEALEEEKAQTELVVVDRMPICHLTLSIDQRDLTYLWLGRIRLGRGTLPRSNGATSVVSAGKGAGKGIRLTHSIAASHPSVSLIPCVKHSSIRPTAKPSRSNTLYAT